MRKIFLYFLFIGLIVQSLIVQVYAETPANKQNLEYDAVLQEYLVNHNVISVNEAGSTYCVVEVMEGCIVCRKIKIINNKLECEDMFLEVSENEENEFILMSVTELSQNKDLIIKEATKVIIQNEGSYGTVNKMDTNSAGDSRGMSIGKFQWNAYWGRALPLLQTIVMANPTNAKNILGTTLYNEIANNPSTYWDRKAREATDSEAIKIKALLETAEGKAAQDALIAVDTAGYVNSGINLGIVSGPALVYYADLRNQWGDASNTMAGNAKQAVGSYSAITLYSIHQAALNYSSQYNYRRKTTYNYINSLGWSDYCNVILSTPQITHPASSGGLPGFESYATFNKNWSIKEDGSVIDVWCQADNADHFNYSVKKITTNPNPQSDNEGIKIEYETSSAANIKFQGDYGTWYKVGVQAVSKTGNTSAWKVMYIGVKPANPEISSPSSIITTKKYGTTFKYFEMEEGETKNISWINGTNNTDSFLKFIELVGEPNPSSNSEPSSKDIVNMKQMPNNQYNISNLTAGKWYKIQISAKNNNFSENFSDSSWLINPVYIYVNPKAITDVSVENITLDETEVNLLLNEQKSLNYFIQPSNATNKAVTWKSSNTSVATVNQNGVVTVNAVGSATITITSSDGGHKASCNVNVSTAPVPETELSWRDYNDGEEVDFDIETDDYRLEPPFILFYETNSNKLPDVNISGTSAKVTVYEGVIELRVNGTGKTTDSLTVDNKTITFTLNVKYPKIEQIYWTNYSEDDTSFTEQIDFSSEEANIKHCFSISTDPIFADCDDLNVTVSDNAVLDAELEIDSDYIGKWLVISYKKAGTSTITISDGSNSISMTIDVISVTIDKLYNRTVEMKLEDEYGCSLPFPPSRTATHEWISSNPSVASVSDDGIITANKIGYAIVSYIRSDGYIVNYEVTVKGDRLLGDVNDDGEIDFMDAYMILRSDAGLLELSESQAEAADVNEDGEIDFMDAYLVLRFDAGLISEY